MEKKLNFVKLAGKWFVHLPDYPGHYSYLSMMCFYILGVFCGIFLFIYMMYRSDHKYDSNKKKTRMDFELVVNAIFKRLEVTEGECPCCNPGETKEDRMCPCREYLENDHCCCKLYIKNDSEN